jgi:hypothetical protein
MAFVVLEMIYFCKLCFLPDPSNGWVFVALGMHLELSLITILVPETTLFCFWLDNGKDPLLYPFPLLPSCIRKKKGEEISS